MTRSVHILTQYLHFHILWRTTLSLNEQIYHLHRRKEITNNNASQEASAPWVSSTLTPVQLSRLDFEEFGYQMPSQTLPDISSQAITSPSLDNLSGIPSSINDQPLIPDERSTGCYPIFNAMSTHLQSINQGSDIAPLTYLESPKFR